MGWHIASAASVVLPDDFMATICNNGGLDVTGGPLTDSTLRTGAKCVAEDVATLACIPGCPIVPVPNACMRDPMA